VHPGARLLIFIAAAALATPAMAHAAEGAPIGNPFDSFGGGTSLLVGVGTPLGLLGLEGHLDLRSHAYLTAGVGLGPYPQVAGMAHLRTVVGDRGWAALSAGYGISYGKHSWSEIPCFDGPCARKVGNIYWHNVEASLEFRQPPQPGTKLLIARVFAGVAVAGNRGNLQCVGDAYIISSCEQLHADDGGGPLPYLGASVGVLFR
jgi:hypothetical protein